MLNFHQAVSQTSRPVVIFGASVVGKIVLDSLDILNLKPTCFCDNNAEKQSDYFNDFKVISFEKLCVDHQEAIIVVAAGRYFNEINKQLSNAGFNDVYTDVDVLDCIDFQKIPHELIDPKKSLSGHLRLGFSAVAS